ncbi:MAG: glutaredoxin family protein [Kyrpidia sp.]|nr:glutaredoxin family protein [Kyrpidia sp.]
MSQPTGIVLWSREGCHACGRVKAFLQEKGYTYANIDVAERDHLRDILEAKYGIRHVPVVEVKIDDTAYRAVIGDDLDRLTTLLENR